MAIAFPTARGKRWVPPAPGITPIFISGWIVNPVGLAITTANLEECDALSGQYLLDDHVTIDVTLGKSGVGRGDHLDTLRTNAKEHHEDPLSHTHI